MSLVYLDVTGCNELTYNAFASLLDEGRHPLLELVVVTGCTQLTWHEIGDIAALRPGVIDVICGDFSSLAAEGL